MILSTANAKTKRWRNGNVFKRHILSKTIHIRGDSGEISRLPTSRKQEPPGQAGGIIVI